MLTGIQITFMVFCWVVIFACIFSVIYSVVDMIRAIRARREEIVEMVEKKIKEKQER